MGSKMVSDKTMEKHRKLSQQLREATESLMATLEKTKKYSLKSKDRGGQNDNSKRTREQRSKLRTP